MRDEILRESPKLETDGEQASTCQLHCIMLVLQLLTKSFTTFDLIDGTWLFCADTAMTPKHERVVCIVCSFLVPGVVRDQLKTKLDLYVNCGKQRGLITSYLGTRSNCILASIYSLPDTLLSPTLTSPKWCSHKGSQNKTESTLTKLQGN